MIKDLQSVLFQTKISSFNWSFFFPFKERKYLHNVVDYSDKYPVVNSYSINLSLEKLTTWFSSLNWLKSQVSKALNNVANDEQILEKHELALFKFHLSLSYPAYILPTTGCASHSLGKTDEKCIGKWWKATFLNALPMRLANLMQFISLLHCDCQMSIPIRIQFAAG